MALRLVLLAVLVSSVCRAADPSARRENVKYIRCSVCEEIAKQLSLQIANKRESLSPKKLTEFYVIELAENICDIKKEESEWMFYFDIINEGGTAKLIRHEEEGECGTKCKTIAKACQEVVGDHDTDLAEFIYKNRDHLSAASIAKVLCKDLSKACSKSVQVPKSTYFGEAFAPKSSKDADISKLMRSMSGMPGAPGMKMYSKDDLMNMKGLGGAEDEDEDEDEDEKQAADVSSLSKKSNVKQEISKPQATLKQWALSTADAYLRSFRTQARRVAKRGTKLYKKVSRVVKKWAKNRATNKRAEL